MIKNKTNKTIYIHQKTRLSSLSISELWSEKWRFLRRRKPQVERRAKADGHVAFSFWILEETASPCFIQNGVYFVGT